MKTVPSFPYLTPPEEAVDLTPWTDAIGNEILDRVEYWDPATDLALSAAATVDLDLVRDSCSLGDDAAFALTATWRSTRTRLTASESIELGDLAGMVRAPVEITVPGASTGGTIGVRVQLVLRAPGSTPSIIAPRRPGAILWQLSDRIALEGSGARFPIAAVDFTETPGMRHDAQWTLDWDRDNLESPALGNMRLLVNASSEQLIGALKTGSDDPRSELMRKFVRYDTARSLVLGALANSDFVERPDLFEEGSMGKVLHDLIQQIWKGASIPALAERAVHDPARIDREIQAHVRIL